jgi:basic membrane lipoprotein Med (substrate-binding protein (PBP1-ABC) superfamily)
MLVGCIFDQHDIAPDLIMTSVVQNLGAALLKAAQDAQAGTLEGTTYLYGLDSGAIGLAPFYDMVPAEVEESVSDIEAQIISGEIEVPRTEG